jgi:SnoaL-like polyketide cyclase
MNSSFDDFTWKEGKFALADEILTPDFVLHNPVLPLELTKGPEGVKRFASGVVDSCPDINLRITKQYPKETRY